MSISSNSKESVCSICGSVREEMKLAPCSHDGMCFLCVRRIKDAKCPFCRRTIRTVKSVEGMHSFKKLHSKYIADEKRDKKETVQFLLFGPSAEENNALLNLLVSHSEKNDNINVDLTKYSPNCSYSNLKSRITLQVLPKENVELSKLGDRYTADAVAILIKELDNDTLKHFRDWHSKVCTVSKAPIVWLIKHADNAMSVCSGDTIKTFLGKHIDQSLCSEFSELMVPVVDGSESTIWTKNDAKNIYECLWYVAQSHKIFDMFEAMFG